MTYDELKGKLNDLPHSRRRAEIVDAIYSAAIAAGHETVATYIEAQVKQYLLGVRPPSTLFDDEIEAMRTLKEEAVEMSRGRWAGMGYPGARDAVSMDCFLKDPAIHGMTHDELTPGQKQKWSVAVSHHKRYGVQPGGGQ